VTTRRSECAHICLVGAAVSDDSRLIQCLRARHAVTVAAKADFLARTELLAATAVMVLDGTGIGGTVLQRLQEIRERYPDLRIVLVDGGLNQLQIAEAFRLGACDYFAEPYDTDLLIERVGALCIDDQPSSPTDNRQTVDSPARRGCVP